MNQQIRNVLQTIGASPENFEQVCQKPEIWHAEIATARALKTWQQLREVFPQTGMWPILRELDCEYLGDDPDVVGDPVTIPAGTIREVLQGRFRECCDFAKEFVPDLDWKQGFEAVAAQIDGSGANDLGGRLTPRQPWPSEPPSGDLDFHTLRERTSRPVLLALVAVNHPHEAPLALGFGGWNECPEPALIAAALREWNKTYGAVPVCLTNDSIECFVERPPQTEAASHALAAEQWVLCSDIVEQGTMSVRALAMELWKSPQWFFWWD